MKFSLRNAFIILHVLLIESTFNVLVSWLTSYYKVTNLQRSLCNCLMPELQLYSMYARMQECMSTDLVQYRKYFKRSLNLN